MEFISSSPFDSKAEEEVWNILKNAFEDEPGFCWHNHPVTGISGNYTALPDVILLHPTWGLVVIEVKGCRIDQIESIHGHTWYMTKDWYEPEMTPLYQARQHMWTIIDRMKDFRYSALRDEKGNCKVTGKEFVCLPYMVKSQSFCKNRTA